VDPVNACRVMEAITVRIFDSKLRLAHTAHARDTRMYADSAAVLERFMQLGQQRVTSLESRQPGPVDDELMSALNGLRQQWREFARYPVKVAICGINILNLAQRLKHLVGLLTVFFRQRAEHFRRDLIEQHDENPPLPAFHILLEPLQHPRDFLVNNK